MDREERMITFSSPFAFLLLPLIFLLRFILPASRRNQQAAINVPFFSVLNPLLSVQQGHRFWQWRHSLFYLMYMLLVIALAGPQHLGRPVNLPRKARNIMMAIDLSDSMKTSDFSLGGKNATRLSVVKKVAGDFIKNRQGDRLGLVVFGTRAYLRTPLTFDLKTVDQALQDSSIRLAGPMTAIGDGVGLAIKRLQGASKKNRVLVVLTDGVNTAGIIQPLQVAKLAAQKEIKIYTIGIGADRLVQQTFFGTQVVNPSQDLDEAMLRQMAKITGGRYFRAKDSQALVKTYHDIDELEPSVANKEWLHPVTLLYCWPLGIALLLAFLLIIQRLFNRWRYRRQLKAVSE